VSYLGDKKPSGKDLGERKEGGGGKRLGTEQLWASPELGLKRTIPCGWTERKKSCKRTGRPLGRTDTGGRVPSRYRLEENLVPETEENEFPRKGKNDEGERGAALGFEGGARHGSWI